ncbi:MAG: ABC transporter ATP-binding protein [Candidatus Zixiibacteriota bacterium]
MFRLKADNLGKQFGSRKVFSGLSFELTTGQSLAITGRNGTGKSTLLMLLLGLYHPTRGQVGYVEGGAAMDDRAIRFRTALVAPYLNLYDQLTGEENLVFLATLAGINLTGKRIDELLARVGLEGRGVDRVGTYSSGMKQRLKYAAALLKDPAYLFLDEPSSNLDADGKQVVRGIIGERRKNSVVVIATNEEEEYALVDGTIRLGQ